ncbi:hypothetical protein D3C72_1997150 [compost metagenome]
MLQGNIAFRVHEVQGHVIVQPHAEKRPERLGRGTSEDLAEEVGGDLLVVRKDDGVVELAMPQSPGRICARNGEQAGRGRPAGRHAEAGVRHACSVASAGNDGNLALQARPGLAGASLQAWR